jgi:predicted phage terminase large subunit-like protein
VRNLIDEEVYARIFPQTKLSKDSKSAAAWSTTRDGGAYYTGVGGALAGRGSDLLLIDDPHNEQDALSGNPAVFQQTYDWYGLAFQRRQQGGRVVIIHTRWAKNDLIGCVLEQAQKNPLAPQYHYVELPMELPSGKALWPEMFNEKDIAEIKNAIPLHRWMSQYQQQPTSSDTALVPRTAWRRWVHDKPPQCDYIMISLDSALEANKRSDYSVFAVLGVFSGQEQDQHYHPHASDQDDAGGDDRPLHHIILLDAVRKRMEYPELKQAAVALAEEWQPDVFIIEKKASGMPLLQEMRRMRLPVIPFEPLGDKYSRLAQVTDLFDMGLVWVPEGYRWAEEFIEEVSDFPGGVNDDCVDALSQALSRFKKGAFAPRKLVWDTRHQEEQEYRSKCVGFYRVR